MTPELWQQVIDLAHFALIVVFALGMLWLMHRGDD